MNEEDTFNTLKKVPFKQVYDMINQICLYQSTYNMSIMDWNEWLETKGWSRKEYEDELWKGKYQVTTTR